MKWMKQCLQTYTCEIWDSAKFRSEKQVSCNTSCEVPMPLQHHPNELILRLVCLPEKQRKNGVVSIMKNLVAKNYHVHVDMREFWRSTPASDWIGYSWKNEKQWWFWKRWAWGRYIQECPSNTSDQKLLNQIVQMINRNNPKELIYFNNDYDFNVSLDRITIRTSHIQIPK